MGAILYGLFQSPRPGPRDAGCFVVLPALQRWPLYHGISRFLYCCISRGWRLKICVCAIPLCRWGGYPQERLVDRVDVNGCATGTLQVFCECACGAVCTTSFDDRDAQVACRQLGFAAGISTPQESGFRRPPPNPVCGALAGSAVALKASPSVQLLSGNSMCAHECIHIEAAQNCFCLRRPQRVSSRLRVVWLADTSCRATHTMQIAWSVPAPTSGLFFSVLYALR